jgi:hypothetical protein
MQSRETAATPKSIWDNSHGVTKVVFESLFMVNVTRNTAQYLSMKRAYL